jgi:hypothetical protein
VSLILLVLFFSAAGELFRSTDLLSSGRQDFSNRASRIDSALLQLRRDVWNSSRITAGDLKSIELSTPDGARTAWKIESGSVTRTDPRGQIERWETLGGDWSLSTDGVSLSISDGSAAPIRLASQLLLWKRGHS